MSGLGTLSPLILGARACRVLLSDNAACCFVLPHGALPRPPLARRQFAPSRAGGSYSRSTAPLRSGPGTGERTPARSRRIGPSSLGFARVACSSRVRSSVLVVKFSLRDGMLNISPPRFVLRSLSGFALATAAYAQAAVEYAAKSSTSAISGSGGSARLGACPVDGALITCVKQAYPVTFHVAVAGACVFVVTLLFRQGRRV